MSWTWVADYAALVTGCVWLVAANLLGMIPSRDNHWFRAYVLIAIGLPLLGWIAWERGIWVALVFFAAGASVLRWPLIYLSRWVRRMMEN